MKSIALIAGLLFSTAALAETKSSKTDGEGANKKICKSIEITGSRLNKKRVCMTALQWDEERRATRDSIEGAQRNSNTLQGE